MRAIARHPRLTLIAVLLVLIALLVAAPGCKIDKLPDEEPKTPQEAVQRIEMLGDLSPGELAALRAAMLEDGFGAAGAKPWDKAALEFVEVAIEHKTGLPASVQKVELGTAMEVADGIEDAAGLFERFIPAPWGGLIALGAPLVSAGIGVFAGKRKWKGVGKGLAKALEMAKNAAGQVDFKNPATKRILDGVMGETGKQLVDEVQAEMGTKAKAA